MNNRFYSNLLEVEKPVRYTNAEYNIHRKENAELNVVLSFPDVYEIGMSNLGFLIIYHLLNSIDGINCERVFTPWEDACELLGSLNEPLKSLESRTPLDKFDVIAFSIHSELNFTNILKTLDLGNLPLKAVERDGLPIVLGGGYSCYNPEPLCDFFDCFVIGEGEEVSVELFNTILQLKRESVSDKDEILSGIRKINGVYIPHYYTYTDTWSVPVGDKSAPDSIESRVVKNIDSMFYISEPVVPNFQVVHDRVSVEIARGCVNGCRFCQSGMVRRPSREREPQKIVDIIFDSLESTGFGEISLLSLNSRDYSQLEFLVSRLSEHLSRSNISISLPSLRVDCPYREIMHSQAIRPTQLTFAPEVASESLQARINKCYERERFEKLVRDAFKDGLKSMKLYYMIGLPFEQEEDVYEIPKMVKDLLKVVKSVRRDGKLVVHISPFTPKPHTPFQWAEQLSVEELNHRLNILKSELPKKSIELRWQDIESSWLECLLSRGDRKIGEVIQTAYKHGASFDGWSDKLKIDIWKEAFNKTAVTPDIYIKGPELEDELPWGHIKAGPDKEYLKLEWEKSVEGKPTPPCLERSCRECGVCDNELNLKFASPETDIHLPDVDERLRWIREHTEIYGKGIIRFTFAKDGVGIYLSNLDILRAFELSFRRAGIPIKYSKGYNPRPKISLVRALPIGIKAEGELGEIALREPFSPIEFIDRVNEKMPEGLILTNAKIIGEGAPQLHTFDLQRVSIRVPEDIGRELSLIDKITQFSLNRSMDFERTKGVRTFTLKNEIKNLNTESNDGYFKVTVDIAISSNAPSLKIEEVTGLFIPEEFLSETEIISEGIFMSLGDDIISPLDLRLLGN